MSLVTIGAKKPESDIPTIKTILNGTPLGRRVMIKRRSSGERITVSGISVAVNEELQNKIIVEIVQVGPECTAILPENIGDKCVIFNVGAEWYNEFEDGHDYGEIGETEVLRLLKK
jgi:co-chaperonin GroES (HSP10)